MNHEEEYFIYHKQLDSEEEFNHLISSFISVDNINKFEDYSENFIMWCQLKKCKKPYNITSDKLSNDGFIENNRKNIQFIPK